MGACDAVPVNEMEGETGASSVREDIFPLFSASGHLHVRPVKLKVFMYQELFIKRFDKYLSLLL